MWETTCTIGCQGPWGGLSCLQVQAPLCRCVGVAVMEEGHLGHGELQACFGPLILGCLSQAPRREMEATVGQAGTGARDVWSAWSHRREGRCSQGGCGGERAQDPNPHVSA